MKRTLAVLMLSVCLSAAARAQNLVDFSRNTTLSTSQINERIAKNFGASVLPRATQNVDLFKVRYNSRDERGRNVVLSGLLALPITSAPKGLVVFNHGTMADRATSPSRFRGENKPSEAQLATLAFASGGYAVVMPDYLGLGDHNGAHPYPLGSINARSAIDIINPARQIIARRGVPVGPRLFVTGYSEGGAVSMWTVRELERENVNLRVYSAANLSGPYDLSGVTRQSLLSSTSKLEEFVPRLYLMANIVYYQHKNSGVRLTKYFKPAMANTVFNAFGRGVSDENIIKRLALTATLMRAQNRFDRVLDPKFLRALQNNDSREPIVRALKQNDTFNWSPRTPQLLVALQNDSIVTSQNTTKTLRAMRARGVGANVVRQVIVRDNKLNHVTFMPQALVIARRFFDGGFAAVSGAQ